MFGLTFKKAKFYNPFLGCPSGYKKQTGYTRKDGKRVPTRCVHSSTNSIKRIEQKKYMFSRKQNGGDIFGVLRSDTRKCPKGQVYRKGYTRKFHTKTRQRGYSVQRKDGTRYKIFPKHKEATVKSTCIKEKGRSASLQDSALERKCMHLQRGEMARYNYQYRLPVSARRLAIKRAIQDASPLKVQKRLALAAKCSARVKPAASKVFKEDANYIRDTYAIESFIKK
jgi:hypothetical protein